MDLRLIRWNSGRSSMIFMEDPRGLLLSYIFSCCGKYSVRILFVLYFRIIRKEYLYFDDLIKIFINEIAYVTGKPVVNNWWTKWFCAGP